MKLLRLLCLSLLTWAALAGVSFAMQDDGVLEHLSGPGPFVRWIGFNYRPLCITNVKDKNYKVALAPWGRGSTSEFGVTAKKKPERATTEQNTAIDNCLHDDKVRAYVAVAWGNYFSLQNNLFDDPTDKHFKVKADSFSVRFMGRTAADIVDVGFGFNVYVFHGAAFDTFARASVEPFRVSVAPFAALGSTERTRAFRVGVAPTIFLGKMDEGDFCTEGRCGATARPFSSRGEIVWAVNVEFDLLALARGGR